MCTGNLSASAQIFPDGRDLDIPSLSGFVIAGVFREPGNAERLVSSLKQEGYSDAEIVNPESSVKKVCYQSFASREEAVATLQQLRSADKEGWVFKK